MREFANAARWAAVGSKKVTGAPDPVAVDEYWVPLTAGHCAPFVAEASESTATFTGPSG